MCIRDRLYQRDTGWICCSRWDTSYNLGQPSKTSKKYPARNIWTFHFHNKHCCCCEFLFRWISEFGHFLLFSYGSSSTDYWFSDWCQNLFIYRRRPIQKGYFGSHLSCRVGFIILTSQNTLYKDALYYQVIFFNKYSIFDEKKIQNCWNNISISHELS